MNQWAVVTPEVETYPATETEPAEHEVEVVIVAAKSQRAAIKAGVKVMLKDSTFTYCAAQRADKRSPYTGVKAHYVGRWPKEGTTK
jgi:ethanolamine utilization microcompartment shell protein EutL